MRVRGTCYVLFGFDIGFEIDLEAAERRLATPALRDVYAHKRPSPVGGPAGSPAAGAVRATAVAPGLGPPRLRLTNRVEPIAVGARHTDGAVALSIYEFGGLCATFRIAFDAALDDLVRTSTLLYDNEAMLAAARRLAGGALEALGPAVREGRLAEVVEDYVIYHIEQGDAPAADLAGTHAATIARLLRAEERALSAEEVEGTLRGRISYAPDEVAFLDWFGACLFGPAMDDERLVLELANMELVELRFLDARLDRWILQAYGALTRTHRLRYAISPHSRVLAQIARMQADSATLHEATSNAVKLLGDDYLARFYDVAARRFHAAAWDASIERKIQTLDSIYSKLSDLAGRRRAELLEWIIIAFFALDIVLQLWG